MKPVKSSKQNSDIYWISLA